MRYYTLQVKTRGEEQFIKATKPFLDGAQCRLICLRKKMKIRRQGAVFFEEDPLFPGYLFLETEGEILNGELYWRLRKTDGFYRFLKSNSEPTPLMGNDLSIIRHFMSFGPTVGISKAVFDENDRISVTDGPLKGLEGCIVKINKRKGRAKVCFDMYSDSVLLDLAFEALEKNER